MSKIRIGLCGIGRAGWGMHTGEVNLYPDDFEFTGACDLIPERMEAMCRRYASCKAYPEYKDMLKADDIDLVVIAVPTNFHTDYAIMALEAGKYVLIEKPIAINTAEADRLGKAADKYPGKLFCRHNRRFEAYINHVKEIIASGVLGKITEFKIYSHSYSRRNDWQTLKSCNGGMLNNWGPHLIDHALQLLDYKVADVWSNLQLVSATGDAEDFFKIIFTGTNGTIGEVESSGCVCCPEPLCKVYGQYGSIVVPDEKHIWIKRLDLEKCTTATPATEIAPPVKLGDFGSAKEVNDRKSDRAVFDNTGGLVWIEETIECAPSNGATINDTYKHIARNLKEGIPFPVTFKEAYTVVKYTELVRKKA